MSFFHFGTYKPVPEVIEIALTNCIFIQDELEEHIRKALEDGTLDRIKFIVPSPIGLNLSTGKGTPQKLISDEELASYIKEILEKIRREG